MSKRPTLEQLLVAMNENAECTISFHTANDTFPKEFRHCHARLNDLYAHLVRFAPNLLSRQVYKINLKCIDTSNQDATFDLFLMNDESDPLY